MHPVVISPVNNLSFNTVTSILWFFLSKLFSVLQCRHRCMESLALLQIRLQHFNRVLHCPTHECLFLPNDLLSTAIHSAAPWPGAQYRDHAQCAREVLALWCCQQICLAALSTLPSFCSQLQLKLFCSCSLPICIYNSQKGFSLF